MGGCTSSDGRTPVGDSELVVREFFDQYDLGEKLGRGAFATVRSCYKMSVTGALSPMDQDGERQKKGNERAVKIIDMRSKLAPFAIAPEAQESAMNEAHCWKAIDSHPNCVRLHDQFFSGELCFMVMEKCQGSLFPALEALPEFTERGLGQLAAQMLLGISHCHSVKVVHRDIKADNFMIGGDGRTIKLVDFGLSAMIQKLGKVPGIFGTAPFMCPEMLKVRQCDDKADVWSLGVVLYSMMYGQFPYTPQKETQETMKTSIANGFPAPVHKPVQQADASRCSAFRSRPASDLVKKLLTRDPLKRPSAAATLHMPWITAAMKGVHMESSDLPCLKSMLMSAHTFGAFEARDPAKHTKADTLLNDLSVASHGRELPEVLQRRRKSVKAPLLISTAAPKPFALQRHGSGLMEPDEPSPSDSPRTPYGCADQLTPRACGSSVSTRATVTTI